MFLIFDIFLHHIRSCFVSYTPDKISVVPYLPTPHFFPHFRKFLVHFTSRDTLQYLYHSGGRISWRCFDKYMYVVFLYHHYLYPKPIFFSYTIKYLLQILGYLPTQYMRSVLRYPYNMIFEFVNRVACSSYTHALVISLTLPFTQMLYALFLRLTANHFPPASKLSGYPAEF